MSKDPKDVDPWDLLGTPVAVPARREIDLEELAPRVPVVHVRAPGRDADGAIDLDALVAAPGFAPKAWQTEAPRDIFAGNKPPVQPSADLNRVLALPRRPKVEPDTAEARRLVAWANDTFGLKNAGPCSCAEIDPQRAAKGSACITALKMIQAWGLHELHLHNGLLGIVTVGGGKTILGMLAPLAVRGCKKALLIVPPTLVEQLIREYRLLSQHFRVPELAVHGTVRVHFPRENAPQLNVLPYSWLSRPTSTQWLENLGPDLIIADEADKLANANSAGTSRVLRYFQAHADTTRFACWSGSITDDHLADYAHLSALALREGSPLPIDPETVDEWGRAIDPSDYPAPPGALLQLCDARDASDDPAENVHEGFYRRLTETPGVVTSTGAAISTPLVINERVPPAIPNTPRPDPRAALDAAMVHVHAAYGDGCWPGLVDCLKLVRDKKIRPDGEELLDPLEWTRCAMQLACGFFYRWRFPRGESKELIAEWKLARKEWRRELRKRLSKREPHLDSEYLGEQAAMRAWGDKPQIADLPSWQAVTWPRWRDIRAAVMHETETILLDDYLARDAAEWGRTHRGVIWYETRAFGEWVARLSGLPLHTGGANAAKLIAKEKGDRSIVASISSHGRGRDGLQRVFCDQLVAMPPSSSSRWEQLLGRLSREGQTADRVDGEVYAHTRELRRAISQALRRAAYVEGTVGAAQKLTSSLMLEGDTSDLMDEEAIEKAEWTDWNE